MKIQINTAIPIVKNNEGKNIFISHTCFDELGKMYKEGCFSAIIKTSDGKTHCIVLSQNSDKFKF